MRAFLLSMVALGVVACASSSASSPTDAGDAPDATDAESVDAPADVSCSGAMSLDARCCSSKYLLYDACPRDFGSFGALCSDESARLFLNATPCAGMVLAAVAGVDTAFAFAFDAATGALRAVLYGGAPFTCEGADDPSLVIPAACLAAAFPYGPDRCNIGSVPPSESFVPFCATRPEGEAACTQNKAYACGYPLVCSAGKCALADTLDAGGDNDVSTTDH